MISEREKFLMKRAMEASFCYDNLEEWLDDIISDSGDTVKDYLSWEANLKSGIKMVYPKD